MRDLSAGLLVWIYDGKDMIFMWNDYPGKRFKIGVYTDNKIKTITFTGMCRESPAA
jgi:hypothetical protein